MKLIVNPARVCGALIGQFKSLSLDAVPVFDPMLSWDTSLKEGIRTKRIPEANDSPPTLLAWSRSSLRKITGMRHQTSRVQDAEGVWHNIKFIPVTFMLNFKLMSPSFRAMEEFELGYLLEESINSIRNIECELDDISGESLVFSFKWGDELDELDYNLDGNFFKSLGTSAEVTGVVMAAENTSDEELDLLIKRIDVKVFNMKKSLLDEFSITEDDLVD